jgi:hypothetical protein
MEKLQKITINLFIVLNMLYLSPFLLLFLPLSLYNLLTFKGVSLLNVFIDIYLISFIILSVLIFTERHKSFINIIIFFILVIFLLSIYYVYFVAGNYLIEKYGYETLLSYFSASKYKDIPLNWKEISQALLSDINQFFPVIRGEMLLQILFVNNLIGSLFLLYREIGVLHERKKQRIDL